jgi:hypothetical protein
MGTSQSVGVKVDYRLNPFAGGAWLDIPVIHKPVNGGTK